MLYFDWLRPAVDFSFPADRFSWSIHLTLNCSYVGSISPISRVDLLIEMVTHSDPQA